MKNILHTKTPSIQFNSPFSIIHSPLLKTFIMKNILLITLLFLTSPFWRVSNVLAQNLVPNPSFEDTVACPFGAGQLNLASGWSSYRNSPDYFNSCSNSNMSVPMNIAGYQFAHSGNAYCGVATWWIYPNIREYVGIQLLSPTIIGQKYYVSFFVSFSCGGTVSIATNKMGCTLSTLPYSVGNPFPINNQSLFHSDSILTDTVNWIKLSTSFIADSAYQYLIIGNFYDDNNTDTLSVNNIGNVGYYYIDDVCLTTDSIYNDTWTGIEYHHESNISIIPNPANTFIKINGMEGELEINIYDLVGRIVRHTKINNNLLNTESISNGIYLIKIDSKDKTIIKKILIQH